MKLSIIPVLAVAIQTPGASPTERRVTSNKSIEKVLAPNAGGC